jgi:hypothetical protein
MVPITLVRVRSPQTELITSVQALWRLTVLIMSALVRWLLTVPITLVRVRSPQTELITSV